jgi:hypothetical protein
MTVRRLKTYAASQGFVYQYYFVGKRQASESDAAEFVFDVTSDRKQTYAVCIVLPQAAVLDWAQAHRRNLTDAEQYAGVKLRLFRGFDEIADMQAHGRQLRVESPFLEEALASLGVDTVM